MEHGEKIVSAVAYQDYIIIFGEYGSVMKMVVDQISGHPVYCTLGTVQRGG